MKTRPTLLQVAISAAIGALVICGCASTSRTAYKTEAITQASVETLMISWGNYVAKNHPPAAVEQKVKAAYENYQRSMLLAVDISQHASQFASKEESESALTRAVTAAGTAFSDLQTLIWSITQPSR